MSITILTASDIDSIIADRFTLDAALASQRSILTAFSDSDPAAPSDEPRAIQIPLRSTVVSDHVTALCMPSRVKVLEPTAEGDGTGIGVKLVAVPHDSLAGLPATTTLFDGRTGQLVAVVNSRNLTALRNACGMSPLPLPARPRNRSATPASALFIRSLPEVSSTATSLVLFGSGAQARYHARVLIATVPTLHTITIVARRVTERLHALVRELQDEAHDVRYVVDQSAVERVVQTADIICTMTSSTVPLFHSPVKPSCAIILIGSYKPHMREITPEVLAQGREAGRRVVVDSREACLREAGELIDGRMGEGDVVELGEVLAGASMGGEPGREVYVFKSVSRLCFAGG